MRFYRPLGYISALTFDLDDTLPNREVDELGPAVQAELVHQMLAVAHRGLHADVEEVGDVLVALPLGDELEHLLLTVGEAVVAPRP